MPDAGSTDFESLSSGTGFTVQSSLSSTHSAGGSSPGSSRKFASELSPRSPSGRTVTWKETVTVSPAETEPVTAIDSPSKVASKAPSGSTTSEPSTNSASSRTPDRSSTRSTAAAAVPSLVKVSVYVTVWPASTAVPAAGSTDLESTSSGTGLTVQSSLSSVHSGGGSSPGSNRKFASELSPRCPSGRTVTWKETVTVSPAETEPVIAIDSPSKVASSAPSGSTASEPSTNSASSRTPERSSTRSTDAAAVPLFANVSVYVSVSPGPTTVPDAGSTDFESLSSGTGFTVQSGLSSVHSAGGSSPGSSRKSASELSPRSPSGRTVTWKETVTVSPGPTMPATTTCS